MFIELTYTGDVAGELEEQDMRILINLDHIIVVTEHHARTIVRTIDDTFYVKEPYSEVKQIIFGVDQ